MEEELAICMLLFLINVWKFIHNPGSEVQIQTILFNMRIYLAIIILIAHIDEIKIFKMGFGLNKEINANHLYLIK